MDELEHSGGGRPDTWLGTIRSFWRLWGFLSFFVVLLLVFRSVVLPFVLAVFIAYVIAPIVKRLEPVMGRALGVVLTYLVLGGVLTGVIGLLLPALAHDASRLRDSVPGFVERLESEWLPQAGRWLEESFGPLQAEAAEVEDASRAREAPTVLVEPQEDGSYAIDLRGAQLEIREVSDGQWIVAAPSERQEGLSGALKKLVASKSAELTAWLGATIQSTLAGLFSFLTKFLVTFMVTAFLLIDAGRVRAFMRAMVPPSFREDFDVLARGIDRGMSGVIRGQLIICVINGVLTWVGLAIFGVKYAILLALTAGILSLIPIFGTILSSIPILLLALLSDPVGLAPTKSVAMLAWITGIHLLEANLLNPKIIGESAQIHPVVVIFALLAGEAFYGLAGALLAVPVASMVQTVFLHVRRQLDPRWGGLDGERVSRPRASWAPASRPASSRPGASRPPRSRPGASTPAASSPPRSDPGGSSRGPGTPAGD